MLTPLSALGQQELVTRRSVALTPWYSALVNRPYARANVCCIGDSITGQGTTSYDSRFLGRLRDMFCARYPHARPDRRRQGVHIVSTGEVSYTWPTTITDSPPGVATGPKVGGPSLPGKGMRRPCLIWG